MTTHLSYAQASRQVHAYMEQSLRAFPAGLRLSPLTGDVDLVCSDNDGAPASTPVSIRPAARLDGVGTAQYDAVIDAFVAYWKKQGWHVALDQRPRSRYVVVENQARYECFSRSRTPQR